VNVWARRGERGAVSAARHRNGMCRSAFYNCPLHSEESLVVQFLIDNALLIAVALASGGMLLWPLLRERAAGPSLSTLQATQMINTRRAQVVDVRTEEEFKRGSLPNAKNFPLSQLQDRAAELKKDRPAIVICETGARAGSAAAQLRAAGIAEVFVLSGGLSAWRAAGLPLSV
jgi:rhodanese-related sulfurtransferase